jgi:hypothetical protein
MEIKQHFQAGISTQAFVWSKKGKSHEHHNAYFNNALIRLSSTQLGPTTVVLNPM